MPSVAGCAKWVQEMGEGRFPPLFPGWTDAAKALEEAILAENWAAWQEREEAQRLIVRLARQRGSGPAGRG